MANITNLKDIYSVMLEDRIIFLNGEVDEVTAYDIVTKMLYLESVDSDKDICLYINSPGGNVSDGFAIYDTMKYIKCDVSTICIGMACSMAAFLLSSGARGKRFSLPNSKIMIHQPLGGVSGQASDVAIIAEQILKTKKKINEILADNCNQPYEKLCNDSDRDFYMSAEEACEYGLIDKVLYSRQ
ncbi:MAG: ATP-dependent Clp protease proteolytic subunit [Clostridia bacterium]|nr:ATP-dependent Clp protease proteolytic subunit [Clostridia bacterium]